MTISDSSMEGPSIARRIISALIGQDVDRGLGSVWSRMKNLASYAGLNHDEKRTVALESIEDVRVAANTWCDMMKRRVENRNHQDDHDDHFHDHDGHGGH
jgi:hypothetical protein